MLMIIFEKFDVENITEKVVYRIVFSHLELFPQKNT